MEMSYGLADTFPRETLPSKNCTLVMVPSTSPAAACKEMVAGPTIIVPSTGFVILTEGGEFGAIIVTFTGGEVAVRLRLSVATAVRVCEPGDKVAETWNGLEDTVPSEMIPSKN